MPEGKNFVGVNPELIRPMTCEEQAKRGWTVQVNGVTHPCVHDVRLANEKMGLELRYGMMVEGFDGILFHEPGGGGSVLVPFAIWDKHLFIGLVEEERKNMGGKVLDAPGGFLDLGETHLTAATREFEEETGVSAEVNKVIDLGQNAEPANSNRAIVDTSRAGEGAHFYALEFTKEHLMVSHRLPSPTLVFRKEIKPKQDDKAAEKIFGCRFYQWNVAATKSDLFANAMFSRLFLYLVNAGRVKLSFI